MGARLHAGPRACGGSPSLGPGSSISHAPPARRLQAQRCASGVSGLGSAPAWDPTCVAGFIGVSGAYDVHCLADHLHRRGLYKSLFARIMAVGGRPAFKQLSPHHAFQVGGGRFWGGGGVASLIDAFREPSPSADV
jgi:hypothetical protein